MNVQGRNPVERLYNGRMQSASILDLFAFGLARRESDAAEGEQMAQEVFKRFNKLSDLADASTDDLCTLTGMDRFEAYRVLALIEIGRRAAQVGRGSTEPVSLPQQVADRLSYLRDERKEHFVVVTLDAKLHIQRIATVHIGTVNSSIVGSREVFREAVRDGASSIIVAHNHPSGDPTPSPEDIEVTKHIAEAGRLLDIPLIDHIVLGYNEFVSFANKGLL